MAPDQADYGIDISRAASRIRREEEDHKRVLDRRYQEARRQLSVAVSVAAAFPEVRRIRVWGSVLRRDRFTERSDIDICVEGIESPIVWSRLERALLDVVAMPLDLVRWETLIEPHRESIMARGTVMYESH